MSILQFLWLVLVENILRVIPTVDQLMEGYNLIVQTSRFDKVQKQVNVFIGNFQLIERIAGTNSSKCKMPSGIFVKSGLEAPTGNYLGKTAG